MTENVHIYHNQTGDIWDKIINVILIGVSNRVKERGIDLNLSTSPLPNGSVEFPDGHINIVVFPLFEIESDQLLPKGLSNVCIELYKESRFNFNTIFLIANRADIPDPFNPHKNMTYYAKNLIRNPKFGGMGKAFLMLELIFKQKEIINIVDIYSKKLLDDILSAIKAIKEISEFQGYYGWRKKFHKTFVQFYDNFQNAGKKNIDLKVPDDLQKAAFISTDNKKITWENLEQTNDFYNCLNGILKEKQSAHHVLLELFRAPIPFPLQELVDARNEINTKLKEGNKGKKIRLLLIDNRSDNKFISRNGGSSKPKPLCTLLFSENDGFGLGDIFEIQMLGKFVYKKKDEDEDNTPQFYQNDNDTKLSNYSDFEREYEEFKFQKFKNNTLLTKSEEKYHKAFIDKQNKTGIKNYADLVYYKIKEADFVLLDFFLDNDDTYLAFDFIRDIADIKREKGDVSTTWYFITSAVYDSVMKYSQSGLLAEYYESAVVNAGDDPTNKKREIIFIYKLLTFIQARLRNFEGFEKAFYRIRLFKDDCGGKTDDCKDPHKCFYPIQSLCRKYLVENNEITKIFPGTRQEQESFKENVELTDNIINQFLGLPEADWPMIQRQIEHLNIRLEKRASDNSGETKLKFSCKYILEELQKRSEIY